MGSGYSTDEKTVERPAEVQTPMPDLPPAAADVPAADVPVMESAPTEEAKSDRKRK